MATAKKVTAKKTAPKKTIPKKSKVIKKSKVVTPKSFAVSRESVPFFTFKITDQTVYWLILLVLIFALGIWVINIQINISDIVNEVNRLTSGV